MAIDTGGYGKALFVPLMMEPFQKFKAGTKTVEVRKEGPRWNLDTVKPGRPVLLRRGYSTQDELWGFVHRVEFAASFRFLSPEFQAAADLTGEGSGYFGAGKVLAFSIDFPFAGQQGIGKHGVV